MQGYTIFMVVSLLPFIEQQQMLRWPPSTDIVSSADRLLQNKLRHGKAAQISDLLHIWASKTEPGTNNCDSTDAASKARPNLHRATGANVLPYDKNSLMRQ